MLLSWLRRVRHRKLLAAPFPPAWETVLAANVPLYTALTPAERHKLRDDLRVIVHEKHWEGCGGFVVTDEVKVTIAAHAALLLLGLAHDHFARVSTILVYPTGYRSPDGWTGPDGVVRRDTGALGEAWYDGPVVLAWDAVLSGGQNPRDAQNVVIHEFAHQLDYLDGIADGTPPLRGKERNGRWHRVMTAEFERLKADTGEPKLLDRYGATNPAEFFAVASETFFEKATDLRVRHPDLYAVLADYYNQDPAVRAWTTGTATAPPVPLAEATPYRGSRAVTKTDAGRRLTEDWPGWVTGWWDLHPGMPREYAFRPFEHQITLAVAGLIAIGMSFGLYHKWAAGAVLGILIVLAAVGMMVWLRLAIRWVDRNGVWAGQPADPLTPPAPPPPPPSGP